jgi:hypothetical protein
VSVASPTGDGGILLADPSPTLFFWSFDGPRG